MAMHGESFAKQCTYETLSEIARFILSGDEVASEQHIIDGAMLLAKKILDARVMPEYVWWVKLASRLSL